MEKIETIKLAKVGRGTTQSRRGTRRGLRRLALRRARLLGRATICARTLGKAMGKFEVAKKKGAQVAKFSSAEEGAVAEEGNHRKRIPYT